jgi:hypothetical protein
VVLSCPGVSLDARFTPAGAQPPSSNRVDSSLVDELAAVARAVGRLSEQDRRRSASDWQRALRSRGLSDSQDASRLPDILAGLRRAPPKPRGDDLAAVPTPQESEGLEQLPLFFDPDFGRVALAAGDEGVDLLVLREGGGVESRLASFAYPEHLPRLTQAGDGLLDAYLRYVLDRDAFVGAALRNHDPRGDATFGDQCAVDLREISAAVVSRAIYRAWLHGTSAETLGASEIEAGIRATDADYLDRPTVGRWL